MRAPVRAMGPLKLVVPELATVTSVSPVASDTPPAPKRPETFTVPVPAFNVRLSGLPPVVPLVLPVMVISPDPADP